MKLKYQFLIHFLGTQKIFLIKLKKFSAPEFWKSLQLKIFSACTWDIKFQINFLWSFYEKFNEW